MFEIVSAWACDVQLPGDKTGVAQDRIRAKRATKTNLICIKKGHSSPDLTVPNHYIRLQVFYRLSFGLQMKVNP